MEYQTFFLILIVASVICLANNIYHEYQITLISRQRFKMGILHELSQIANLTVLYFTFEKILPNYSPLFTTFFLLVATCYYSSSIPGQGGINMLYIYKHFENFQLLLIVLNMNFYFTSWYAVFIPYYLVAFIYLLMLGIFFVYLGKQILNFCSDICLNSIIVLILGFISVLLIAVGIMVFFIFYFLVNENISLKESQSF